nr:cobyrinate a,c-diamide synthase [Tepiditoga spiralis]
MAGMLTNSGKTTFTLGLLQYLKSENKKVCSFKIGPDFIDPIYHEKILDKKSKSLDSYFLNSKKLKEHFYKESKNSDYIVIEGVMGLLDGLNDGRGSTDSIGSILDIPILLLVESMPSIKTMAAMIDGVIKHSKSKIVGIIITKSKSEIVFNMQKEEIEKITNIKYIKRFEYDNSLKIPSKHLGLDTDFFNIKEIALKSYEKIKSINIESIFKELNQVYDSVNVIKGNKSIAISRDEAFLFYYPENIEWLKNNGFKIKYFSPLNDKKLPEADVYYFTGGYPEVYAKKLEKNKSMLIDVYEKCASGKKIIAECGGFMYLSKEIEGHKMVGFINGKTFMSNKIQGRFGYEKIKILNECFFKKNTVIKGHEFHYSYMELNENENALEVIKKSNNKIYKVGIIKENVLASYTHFYFSSILEGGINI